MSYRPLSPLSLLQGVLRCILQVYLVRLVANPIDRSGEDGRSRENPFGTNWTRKFQFSYAVDNDYVKDKMQNIAAYMIQRAFRCGWDYRRAFED